MFITHFPDCHTTHKRNPEGSGAFQDFTPEVQWALWPFEGTYNIAHCPTCKLSKELFPAPLSNAPPTHTHTRCAKFLPGRRGAKRSRNKREPTSAEETLAPSRKREYKPIRIAAAEVVLSHKPIIHSQDLSDLCASSSRVRSPERQSEKEAIGGSALDLKPFSSRRVEVTTALREKKWLTTWPSHLQPLVATPMIKRSKFSRLATGV